MKRFLENFFKLSFSTILINIIETFTSAYITKKLGTTFLGSFSLVNTLFKFLMTVSLFGIPLAITKLVSEEDASSQKGNIATISKLGCKICAITSMITCIITIIFCDKISQVVLPNFKDLKVIIVLAISLPFIAISSVISGYFQALRKINVTVIDEFLSEFSRSAILVLLISLKYNSYIIFSISILISQILSFLYTFIMFKIDLKRNNSSNNRSITQVKKILKIALPISFTSFIRSGLSTLKHSLIPSRLELYGFSKDYALSRYGIVHGIALPFVLIPWMVIECFASLILPEYSRYFAQNNTEKITNITNYIFENTFYISIFISFFIYIISDDICMAIYSNSEVSYYVKILCPLIPIMYIDTIVDNMLRGLDLQLKVMQVNILDVVISIILIYFGVPYLGTFGYILVIYAGEYLNGVLSIEILLKNINVKFKYFKWLLFPIVVGFIFLYLTSYISNSTIIQSILFTILYLLYYLFQKKDKA